MTSFNELRNRTGGFKKGTKAAYFWCALVFVIKILDVNYKIKTKTL